MKTSPPLLENQSVLILEKGSWFCPSLGQIYYSKSFLRGFWKKNSERFPCRAFFPWILRKCLSKSPNSWNLPCAENFLVLRLHIYDISNLVFVHWNCIDSIYKNLGGQVVWYLKTWPGFDSQPGSILSTVNYLQLVIYFLKKSLSIIDICHRLSCRISDKKFLQLCCIRI